VPLHSLDQFRALNQLPQKPLLETMSKSPRRDLQVFDFNEEDDATAPDKELHHQSLSNHDPHGKTISLKF